MWRPAMLPRLLSLALMVGLTTVACGWGPTVPAAGSGRVGCRQPLATSTIVTLAMPSNRVGWALTVNPAGVLRTGDGGRTWRNVWPRTIRLPDSSSQVVVVAAFPTPTVAVVAVKRPNGQRVDVYRTTDGGQRWTSVDLRLAPAVASTMTGGSMMLQFVNAATGWLLLMSQGFAGSQLDALYGTQDGGQHWHLLTSSARTPSGTAAFDDVTAIAFAPTGRGIASVNTVVFGTGEVLVTKDSGRLWHAAALPLPATAATTQVFEGAPSLGPSGTVTVPVTFQTPNTTQQLLLETTTEPGGSWAAYRWPTPLPVGPATVGPYGMVGQDFLVAGGRLFFLVQGASTAVYIERRNTTSGLPDWVQVAQLPMAIGGAAVGPSGEAWAVGPSGLYTAAEVTGPWRPLSAELASCL